MKKIWILMLTCLLLCGCDAGDKGITNVSSLTPPTDRPADIRGLYASRSNIEQKTSGAVQVFPLDLENPYGLRSTPNGILVFSGTETTTITLFNGTALTPKTACQLEEWVSHLNPSFQITDSCLSCYLPTSRETLVLSSDLAELRRIPDPVNLSCAPIYHPDSDTLFYCTQNAIFAWDLEQDLHRTLKELSYTRQQLTGLHRDGTVLQCHITDGDREETMFLSTENGKLLHSREGSMLLKDCGEYYFAAVPSGSITQLVFGRDPQQPMALIPKDIYSPCSFLKLQTKAVTVTKQESERTELDLYDLVSGRRTASLTLFQDQEPIAVEDGADGFVYLLCQDPQFGQKAIYRWDYSKSLVTDSKVYTGTHYTRKAPDLEGLENCRILAQEIGDRHGISIRIGKDATLVQPWDYRLESEYLVPVLKDALYALDRQLSLYPKKIFTDTAAHFSSLSINLVRSLTGSVQSGSLETAAGIQFTDGTDAYIVLAVGKDAERTFYHELMHVMDTHLLGNTGALDRWDELNPAGFDYDYSYEVNKSRNSGVYLQSNTRAFVDTYSMSYPKEDRARIMEYAMLPGNKELFQTPTLQRKLKALCQGIRDAYALKQYEERFLWEQYLE